MASLTRRAPDRAITDKARREAKDAERSKPFRWLVRTGFVARGLTYGVIGVLALALAVGAGTDGTKPNQQGALALIARPWPGKLALVVIAAGLLAYAVWKLAQGIFAWGPEGGAGTSVIDRAGNVGGGIVYIGFFLVAVRILAGSAGNSDAAPKHATAGVLGWPGGQELVALGGIVLIVISLYQAWDGATGRFAHDSKTGQMSERERVTFMALGRVGLTARAIVFVLVGYFVLRAAIDFNAKKTVSVDGALARLHHQLYGPWLLGLVAAGLLVFAAYSFFEARYRRL